MLLPGLVSVTYRALSPREIIELCVEAKLEGIEWGGDVHVPPGDWKNALEIGEMTRDAGLEVAAYGSYYRCDGNFGDIGQCAQALGAPLVRVWAGKTDASDATEENWADVTKYLSVAGAMGESWGFDVAAEFHGGTLTATGADARRLMESANARGIMESASAKTLWQPLRRGDDFDAQVEENLAELRAVESYLTNVHVYEWADDADGKRQRMSLENSAQWPRYVEELKRIGGERWLLLEFVPDDDPNVLVREAAALRGFIGS